MKLIFLCVLILFGGCATRTFNFSGLAKKARVSSVPFHSQKKNYCGPATLAMAMNHRKKMITVDELASQMMTPLPGGTYQTDMITASRRNGMMAVKVNDLHSMMKEVESGNPVIVFQNLALAKLPRWHYALVTGYDLKTKDLILHSGNDKNLKTNIGIFEYTWSLGKYWGLVILNPGELSATGSELEHMTAASGLEAVGKIAEAEVSYRSIIEHWPDSLSARIGLANIHYNRSEFAEAVVYLTAATIKHPTSSIAWHNLAIAQKAARMQHEALESSMKALSLADASVKAQYQESLKDITKP
jgi:hypothetical protein